MLCYDSHLFCSAHCSFTRYRDQQAAAPPCAVLCSGLIKKNASQRQGTASMRSGSAGGIRKICSSVLSTSNRYCVLHSIPRRIFGPHIFTSIKREQQHDDYTHRTAELLLKRIGRTCAEALAQPATPAGTGRHMPRARGSSGPCPTSAYACSKIGFACS